MMPEQSRPQPERTAVAPTHSAPHSAANEAGIDYLVNRGRLERITPRQQTAQHLLRECRRHLASARTLSQTEDLSMAFVTAYDAARKALTAILSVQGLRARGGDGGHAVLLDAVRPQFPDHRQQLQRFDWMRTLRNQSEYPDFDAPTISQQDVTDAIRFGESIVELAELYVAQDRTRRHAGAD
jgi:uncharacterized protein (UPF0332 family)